MTAASWSPGLPRAHGAAMCRAVASQQQNRIADTAWVASSLDRRRRDEDADDADDAEAGEDEDADGRRARLQPDQHPTAPASSECADEDASGRWACGACAASGKPEIRMQPPDSRSGQ